MKRRRLTLVLLLFSVTAIIAQESTVSKYSLGAAFGKQKVGIPLVEMLEFPSHTSFLIEATRKYGTPTQESWYQTVSVLTFENTSLGSGYMLQSNIGRGISLGKTLGLYPELGLGLTHRFLPKEVFELSDGKYVPAKDLGSIKPAINLRALIGYNTKSIFMYVSYQLTAEFLYNQDISFLPMNYLHLGVRYSLKPSEK